MQSEPPTTEPTSYSYASYPSGDFVSRHEPDLSDSFRRLEERRELFATSLSIFIFAVVISVIVIVLHGGK